MTNRLYNRRRGVVTFLFMILFVFTFLALAGLVIDLGFVFSTRRTMQATANTAALEGLRFRDDQTISSDAATRDQKRRQRASNLAARFSCGPTVAMSGGIPLDGSTFVASEVMGVTGVYTPALELNNSSNSTSGDLVQGIYNDAAISHTEASDYTRTDFTPDTTTTAGAFLVRLRRTGEASESGVQSSGPPVPFLFARGAPLAAVSDGNGNPVSPSALLDRRGRGTFVRAAAIADAQPALSVGTANSGSSIEGLAGYQLLASFWMQDWDGDSSTPGNGTESVAVILTGTSFTRNGSVVGDTLLASTDAITALGSSTNVGPSTLATGTAFVPIMANVLKADHSSSTQRIIGFARVTLSGTSPTYTLTRQKQYIAPQNASAALLDCRFLAPNVATPIDVADLMDQHRLLATPATSLPADVLRAPALVRSIQ